MGRGWGDVLWTAVILCGVLSLCLAVTAVFVQDEQIVTLAVAAAIGGLVSLYFTRDSQE
jgi:hypothetical protein